MVFFSVGNTMFILHGLAEGGKSAFGRQRRYIGKAKETGRLQGTPVVC